MTVDAKMMKAADFAKVSSIDFVERFATNIKQLQEILGITRKIEKIPGQVIKTYKVTGTLEDGTVGEGEVIPLSKYLIRSSFPSRNTVSRPPLKQSTTKVMNRLLMTLTTR